MNRTLLITLGIVGAIVLITAFWFFFGSALQQKFSTPGFSSEEYAVRINTEACYNPWRSDGPEPGQGYYYDGNAIHFYRNGQILTTLDSPDIPSFKCLDGGSFNISFYASDKNKVYYLGETIVGADSETFIRVGRDSDTHFAKDATHVFYATSTLENANPATFKLHDSGYGIDTASVFYRGYRLADANPASFSATTLRKYVSDDTNVYFENMRLDGIPANQFLQTGGTVPARVVAFPGDKYFEITLQGNYLIWNGGIVRVDDPGSLQHLGLGIFKDSRRFYSNGQVVGIDKLDHTKEIQIIRNETGAAEYLRNGDAVYALVSEMSLPVLVRVESADAATFTILKHGYAKDTEHVFYQEKSLPGANPLNFSSRAVTGDYPVIGFSGVNAYWRAVLLSGIDPTSIQVEKGGTIIRDADSAWFSSGNCHFGSYREGSIEEIPTYIPPC